jgi:predicted ATPase/class 3 adenylate cyclase
MATPSPARRDLPTGTVTFLFTDIEASTRLLENLGPERYSEALLAHRRVVRAAFARHGGVEVDTQGDAFFVAFTTAPDAVAASRDAQEALAGGDVRVRMGLHTGAAQLADEGYVGHDVHRAARIAASGHGGQVLVSAATAALLGADELRDLGVHRLKDLSAPERIYQLGDAEFPPLKTLHQTNLPIPATPFLGRQKEVTDVLGLVSQDAVRLLTLTGPGGTGKTRLALHVAGGLAEGYEHGVWWVPLAALRDPQLVLETAGQVLGVKAGLAAHIAERSMLLLFDNFEHLVDAAVDVAALLASCPNLNVLATSRERLHVAGEQEYPVPPLVPEEGVAFFVARATAVRPDYQPDEAVPQICRQLDDLPLALELAAARVRALSGPQILDRLEQRLPLLTGGPRDAPERQRTLRATIEWSYELLTANEQRLFAALSVFRRGCTFDSAQRIADAGLDTLESLVDKSLLRHLDGRFWMLETIREYAAERLDESGTLAELRGRHAEHFLALAEEAEPHLSRTPREWLDRLEREHDNLRAALDRLGAAAETQLALRLAGALGRFWYQRGHLAEGRRRLGAALIADERPTAARAKALNGLALVALDSGDMTVMRLHAEEALALHLQLGDQRGAAFSRFQLGHATMHAGDLSAARHLFEQSARRFRELGDEHYRLLAVHGLAVAHYLLGELERARALHEQNLHQARALSNERMEARSLGQLGLIAADQKRATDASSMLKEAYRIDRELGEAVEIALDLCRLARALAFARKARTAVQLLARAEALRKEIGATFLPWALDLNAGTLKAVRTELDEAAFDEAWQQGATLSVDDAVALAVTEVAS